MEDRRRGDRRLGQPLRRKRGEEAEIVGDDRAGARQPARRVGRGGDAGAPGFRLEAEHPFLAQPEARERIDHAGRPGAAAELAVGHRRQADPVLEGDDVADRRVLGRAQAPGVEPARPMRAHRLEQPRRPDEAPHMLGAEGLVHGRSPVAAGLRL